MLNISETENRKFAVGFDLNNEYALISYCFLDRPEPESLEYHGANDKIRIPMALFKKKGKELWYLGEDALLAGKQEEGCFVTDLLNRSLKGETEEIEGKSYDLTSLLGIFIKKSMNLLQPVGTPKQVEDIMFTADKVTPEVIAVWKKAMDLLTIDKKKIHIQSYAESYAAYLLNQPAELWNYSAALFDFDKKEMKSMLFKRNQKASPQLIWTDENLEEFFETEDSEMKKIIKNRFGKQLISSVYLIGDGFEGDWMPESLKLLCQGRRVFKGQNLYAKGACYAAKYFKKNTSEDAEFLFLDNNKIQYNVGMMVDKKGREEYFSLMQAGVSWYEADVCCEFLLSGTKPLELIFRSIDGKQEELLTIPLTDLPARPPKAARLKLELGFLSRTKAEAVVSDLGFGEIFPSSGQQWRKEILLKELEVYPK